MAIGKAAFPILSLIMIAAVYGLQASLHRSLYNIARCSSILLQALIFLLKREFMLIGWMVVYLLS